MFYSAGLQKLLSQALVALGVDTPDEYAVLEVPENADHGDFSCNAALRLSKLMQLPPRVIAQKIIDAFPENNIIQKMEIAGPGFINFYLEPSYTLQSFVSYAPENPITPLSRKKICVEFSSPNLAKPLHVGHLRSTVIGDSIQRILKHCGHDVICENFLGDWGTGFGKLVVAIEKWGDPEKIKNNPIEELVILYKKFVEEAEKNPELDDMAREAFRKLEIEKDPMLFKKWEWIRSVSIDQLNEFYESLGIYFDWILGESFYASFNAPTLKKIESIGEISEGALIVRFLDEQGEEIMPLILFRRADGATLYQTRDVSHMFYCESEKIDEFITVVAHEQSLHFRQVFSTAKRLGCTMHMEHVGFGLVLGKDGKKFSTRKGTGVGLDDLFEEAKEKVSTIISDRVSDFTNEEKQTLIQDIALGAIKYNDLSQNRNTDIVFDWDKMLSFEGSSGPFLQYSFARANSVLQKNNFLEDISIDVFSSAQILPQEWNVIKKILLFPEIIVSAAENKRPNIVAEYLFALAKLFNGFYQNISISKEEDISTKKFRLYMVKKFATTIKTGLSLLGISAPEKM